MAAATAYSFISIKRNFTFVLLLFLSFSVRRRHLNSTTASVCKRSRVETPATSYTQRECVSELVREREREHEWQRAACSYHTIHSSLALSIFSTLTATPKAAAIHTHTCNTNAAVAVTYLFLQKSNNNLITFCQNASKLHKTRVLFQINYCFLQYFAYFAVFKAGACHCQWVD